MPHTSALLVIDMQNQPVALAHRAAETVAVIAGLRRRALAAQALIVTVQDGGDGFDVGSHGWQVVPELAPGPAETVLRKTSPDSFLGTGLDELLTAHGITEVVVTGFATEICVDTTARAALSHGYDLVLVADGHTTSVRGADDTEYADPDRAITHHNEIFRHLGYPGRSLRVQDAAEVDFGQPGPTEPGPRPLHAEAGSAAATRESYDLLATAYAARFGAELDAKPLERALLAGFAELVRETGGGRPLADVGCGTGRVTGHLHGLGADVFGIDLSPGMLAVARAAHPGIRFEEGSMLALDLPDASLGGLLAWYSVIHLTDALLPAAFAEFHRVLAPGAHVQLGFQVGDGARHYDEAWGHPVALDFHRRRTETIAALLTAAGFEVRVRTVREADTEGEHPEPTPQGFVLARKPGAGAERRQSAGRAGDTVRLPAAISSATGRQGTGPR